MRAKILIITEFIVTIFFSILVRPEVLLAKEARYWDYIYCAPVARPNLSPEHKIIDGKELAYFLLFRSYISSDKNEPAILEKFEFSPDGKVFTGRISENLKWSDGTKVTSKEAAYGIVDTLPFRSIGEKVQIKEKPKILDDRNFQIQLSSNVENLTGTFREALSLNSRHNRFWLKKVSNGKLQILAKNDFIIQSGKSGISVNGKKILLGSSGDCNSPDFTIFPEVIKGDIKNYNMKWSDFPSAITLQTNTKKLSIEERKALVNWIRFAFSNQPKESGIIDVKSFFLQTEPGYSENDLWGSPKGVIKFNKKLKIAYEIPIFRTILQKSAKENNIDVEFIPFPFESNDVDGQVLASGIQDGRHIILQDILQWPHVKYFLEKAPETLKSLNDISKFSAATIPPDSITLQKFEAASSKEWSLAPIARKHPIAYSKKNLDVCLQWSKSGELQFYAKELCKE